MEKALNRLLHEWRCVMQCHDAAVVDCSSVPSPGTILNAASRSSRFQRICPPSTAIEAPLKLSSFLCPALPTEPNMHTAHTRSLRTHRNRQGWSTHARMLYVRAPALGHTHTDIN